MKTIGRGSEHGCACSPGQGWSTKLVESSYAPSVMVGDELEEALTTAASLSLEVCCQICRHLHLAVVLKRGV